jgi:hypothetical protein
MTKSTPLYSNLETASMIRTFASPLAIVLAFSLVTSASAQTAAFGPVVGSAGYGGYSYGFPQSGAFGLEYAQQLPNGGFVMDQYGLLHGTMFTPVTEAAPAVGPVRPATPARGSRSGRARAAAQPRYRLSTGSLGSPGANGGIFYSPGMRYQSYGSYGQGPYGVTNYGYMWKGWNTAE